MSLKKRAVSGVIIAGSLVVMSTIAGTVNTEAVERTSVAVETRTDLATNGTAGIVVRLDQIEAEAFDGIDRIAASMEQNETDLVATAEEPVEEAAEEVMSEEELSWQNRLMANVDDFLYVRSAGDENAEIVGKMYKGDVAEIVEYGDTWTHIISGNVDGWVMNSYCVFGTDAMNYASENFDTSAEIQTNGLRIRREADTDGAVIAAVSTGTELTVNTDAETVDGWVAVEYGGETGYVSADYVTTDLELGEAITLAEEQEVIEKAKAEEEAKKSAQVASSGAVQSESVAASVDDVTLLAALIQCEAGNECYEGQLAVGAVVMNRVKSGSYPGSISGVIYQSGQFPPAGSGSVAAIASRGPKSSCVQAAQEAINGMDNTSGATRFARTSSGHAGVAIGNHVFY